MAPTSTFLNKQRNRTYGYLVNAEDLLRQIPSAVENPKSIPLLQDMVDYYKVYRKGIAGLCDKFEVCSTEYNFPQFVPAKEQVVSLSEDLLNLVMKLQVNIRFGNNLRNRAVQDRLQLILRRINVTNEKYLHYLNYWEDLWAEEYEKYGRK